MCAHWKIPLKIKVRVEAFLCLSSPILFSFPLLHNSKILLLRRQSVYFHVLSSQFLFKVFKKSFVFIRFSNTSISCFSEVPVTPLCFYKRPPFVQLTLNKWHQHPQSKIQVVLKRTRLL